MIASGSHAQDLQSELAAGKALSESPATQTAGVAEPNTATEVANYTVVSRKPDINFFPCSQCHDYLPPNPTQRELFTPHQSTLDHGGNRFWCLTCHDQEKRDNLRRVDGTLLEIDNAPELCASCHMARYRDWKGGAHGKRIGNWQGERVLLACPQCHNPHSPTIKPRAPQKPPPVRRDLERPEVEEHGAVPVWVKHLGTKEGEE